MKDHFQELLGAENYLGWQSHWYFEIVPNNYILCECSDWGRGAKFETRKFWQDEISKWGDPRTRFSETDLPLANKFYIKSIPRAMSFTRNKYSYQENRLQGIPTTRTFYHMGVLLQESAMRVVELFTKKEFYYKEVLPITYT